MYSKLEPSQKYRIGFINRNLVNKHEIVKVYQGTRILLNVFLERQCHTFFALPYAVLKNTVIINFNLQILIYQFFKNIVAIIAIVQLRFEFIVQKVYIYFAFKKWQYNFATFIITYIRYNNSTSFPYIVQHINKNTNNPNAITPKAFIVHIQTCTIPHFVF